MLRRLALPIFAAAIACGGVTATAPTASGLRLLDPDRLRRRLHEADLSLALLQLEPQLRLHRLWPTHGPRRPTDRPVANQLGLGRRQLAHLAHRPPVPRNYPGNGPFGGPYRPTPLWPSDTTEFGVYPVRAPW